MQQLEKKKAANEDTHSALKELEARGVWLGSVVAMGGCFLFLFALLVFFLGAENFRFFLPYKEFYNCIVTMYLVPCTMGLRVPNFDTVSLLV